VLNAYTDLKLKHQGDSYRELRQQDPNPGEEIIHEASISLWTQTPLILLGLILLPVFGIG